MERTLYPFFAFAGLMDLHNRSDGKPILPNRKCQDHKAPTWLARHVADFVKTSTGFNKAVGGVNRQ
jgi:hypothetical protein